MPTKLTPEQRSLRARIASHESWARTPDASARTAPGRKAFLDRFEKQVDPDGTLSPAERERRARAAFRAHMSKLAFASSKARSRKGGDAA